MIEQLINVTEDAAKQVGVVKASEPENQAKTLRVFVVEGGCNGLQYGETVLVDDFSANYVRGATVDYSDSLNDSGFKIKNPNVKQSCGCGNSFETK